MSDDKTIGARDEAQSAFDAQAAQIRTELEARLKDLERIVDGVSEDMADVQSEAATGSNRTNTESEDTGRPQSEASTSRAFRVLHRGGVEGSTDYSNHVGVIEGQVFLDDVLVSEDSTAAFDFYDNSFEVTEETYGWIDLNMEDSEDLKWTMNVGATIPAADADHKIRALFHLPWDSTNSTIDAASVIRYHQGNVHFEAGGVSEPEDPGAAVVTIGSAAEGSEAAETTTWTYAGTNGLKLYAMTRTAYYHAGDKILYGYVRLLTFDKYGRLYSAGAETRVSVDVTVLES